MKCMLGEALTRIYNTAASCRRSQAIPGGIDLTAIRELIDASDEGYLAPGDIQKILDAAGIPRVAEEVATDEDSSGSCT